MKYIIEDLEDNPQYEPILKKLNLDYILLPNTLSYFDYKDWINATFTGENRGEQYFFQGSINLLRLLERNGVNCGQFAFPDYYDFHRWSSYYENCFNDSYIISTVGEVEETARKLGLFSDLFIRPLSGWKLFTGCVTNLEDSEWNHIRMQTKPHDLVVVSAAKVVDTEYRVFVDFEGERVITGSTYGWVGNDPIREYSDELPEPVIEECLNVIRVFKDGGFEPAPFFFIDIHLYTHNNRASLIEIGSPHTCGMYGCDREKIFKTISEYYG
jgi:hypothetical protein